MAKSKKNRKQKGNILAKLSPKGYIRKVARKLPVECKILGSWEERGNTQILVIRKKLNGDAIVGFFMVDLWCLGLKDTFFRYNMNEFEYEALMEQFNTQFGVDDQLITCSPQLAFNIIYGAVEYAEDLGFSPPKDFAITEYLLDDVDDVEYMGVEFGRNGQPYYMPGPDDNIQRVLNTLNKNVGEGNYDYAIYADHLDDGSLKYARHYSMRPAADRIFRKFIKQKDDSRAFAFQIQLMTADLLYEEFEGDFSDLEEEYGEFLIEGILDPILDFLEQEQDGAPYSEEDRSMIYEMVDESIALFMHYGDGEFLFERNYDPLPNDYTKEELEQMSEAERAAFDAEMAKRTSPRKAFKRFVLLFTLNAIAEKVGEDSDYQFTKTDEEAIQEQLLKEVQELAEEQDTEITAMEYRIMNEVVSGAIMRFEQVRLEEE